jgi:hypothetical protein
MIERELFSYSEMAKRRKIPKELLVRSVISGQLKAITNGPNWIRLTDYAVDEWLKGLERVQ